MRPFPHAPHYVAIAAGLLLAFSSALSPAAVVVLDFEEATVPGTGTQIGIAEYVEDGFHIAPLGPIDADPPFRLRRNGGSNTGFPENGSPYLQLATGDSFEMTLLSETSFVPLSVDLAEYSELSAGALVAITFTGYFANDSSVSTTFTTDGVIDGTGALDDFETFVFPSFFAGIVRLEVSEIPDPIHAFSLDRLFVNNVPEPSRALLLSLALASAALQRRRRLPES